MAASPESEPATEHSLQVRRDGVCISNSVVCGIERNHSCFDSDNLSFGSAVSCCWHQPHDLCSPRSSSAWQTNGMIDSGISFWDGLEEEEYQKNAGAAEPRVVKAQRPGTMDASIMKLTHLVFLVASISTSESLRQLDETYAEYRAIKQPPSIEKLCGSGSKTPRAY